jgi:hypothetical protein
MLLVILAAGALLGIAVLVFGVTLREA